MASFDRLLLAFTAIVFTILTIVTSFSADDGQIREQPAFTANR